MTDRNGTTRPTNPTAQAPAAPPAAAQTAAWPGDEARQTVIESNRVAAEQRLRNAEEHRANARRIHDEIGALSPKLEAKRQELEELRGRIDGLIEDERRENLYAEQEQRTSEAYSAAATALETAALSPPVNGVKVFPSEQQPVMESCPRGDGPMRWTAEHGLIHDLPDNGWRPAGQFCGQPQDATQAPRQAGAS
ncbi:hypothetical protein [Sphaerisporangium album]|nr:hypothetical protein [Sphaerisporangium album]